MLYYIVMLAVVKEQFARIHHSIFPFLVGLYLTILVANSLRAVNVLFPIILDFIAELIISRFESTRIKTMIDLLRIEILEMF
ncbi:hypothetical protein BG74_09160 [Sodalis-like endosymbiont of Proechinophthirus fluctus]|nr:hypothetical protein BG74_09160 [Sodalis-like endosymbiont of Proechinophthirus fluctus]